jgi:hypothetical protein
MQASSQYPLAERKDKVRELYKTMPYTLSQKEPIKLRMKNFYFDRGVLTDDKFVIYRAIDPNNPSPETDLFIVEKKYGSKREILFEFGGGMEEYYYAVNARTGERSNLLHFIWEGDFDPVIEKRKPLADIPGHADLNIKDLDNKMKGNCLLPTRSGKPKRVG